MYILSQDREKSVNNTTLSSFGIRQVEYANEELSAKFPKPYAVIAYGKGDKEYLMAVYANKEEALRNLEEMHRAIKRSEKTIEFNSSTEVFLYRKNKEYEEKWERRKEEGEPDPMDLSDEEFFRKYYM